MGGISTAVNLFTNELKKYELTIENIITHSPTNGKLKNSLIFINAIFLLIKNRCNELSKNSQVSPVYLHIGPKGSLIRKLILAYLANKLGMKVYSHYHSATFETYLNSSGLWKNALLLICKQSEKNIVLSSWWHDLFSSHNVQNLAIIPNMVETAADTTKRKESSSEKTIFAISRLVEEKNIQLVMQAMTLLPENFRLIIAGDGPYRKTLENLSQSLNIKNRVEFIGWIDKNRRTALYLESDVLAVPSSHDSFGIIFIEALSLGCPVVIGPNPAVKAALNKLPGVYEANEYTPEEVATAIADATTNSSHATEISSACQAKYAPDIVSNQLNEIFRDKGWS